MRFYDSWLGDAEDIAHVFYDFSSVIRPVMCEDMKADNVSATNSSITRPGQLILDSAAGVTDITNYRVQNLNHIYLSRRE